MLGLGKKKEEQRTYDPSEIVKENAEQPAKKVKILATPIVMNPGEAMIEAKKCGNVFGKALYGKEKITLKLFYLESEEVILNLYYQPAPIMKLFGKKDNTVPSTKIRMVVEGTRGGASYAETPITVQEVTVSESAIQKTDLTEEQIVQRAKIPALRMVRRRAGRVVTGDLYKMRSFYRPHYVAFYGNMEMGSKVRYICIPADGNKVERSI